MNLSDALNIVESKLRQWDETLASPATAEDINFLIEGLQREFGVFPPAGYLEFLRLVNGFEFNGLILYGAREQGEAAQSSLIDVIEVNKLVRESSRVEILEFIVLGEDSTSLLTYEIRSGKFHYRDRIGVDRAQEHSSFDELVVYSILKVI